MDRRFLHFFLSLAIFANTIVQVYANDEAMPKEITVDVLGQSKGEAEKHDQGSLQTRRPKVVLALGGGGTRGAAHIGVIRVLKKEGIPIDAVVGTSMGALIGGLYCTGMDIDQLEEIFYHKKLVHAFDTVPIPVRVALIPVFFVPHLFGYHPYDGLYRGNKFANYLASLAPSDRRIIENLKIPFWAIATNLVDGEPYAIKKGCIGRAVQASSAIPQLRRPVEINGALLVDGGIVENLPIEHALQMNCDYVIAVDVDEKITPVPLNDFRAIGSVARRVININLRRIDAYQRKLTKATIIHPDLDGINLLSLNKADARRAVIAGEKAATKALPSIRQELAELEKKRAASAAP
jgi:NTE family protein